MQNKLIPLSQDPQSLIDHGFRLKVYEMQIRLLEHYPFKGFTNWISFLFFLFCG